MLPEREGLLLCHALSFALRQVPTRREAQVAGVDAGCPSRRKPRRHNSGRKQEKRSGTRMVSGVRRGEAEEQSPIFGWTASRAIPTATGTPIATPRAGQQQCVPQHHPHHVSTARSERHAYADFAPCAGLTRTRAARKARRKPAAARARAEQSGESREQPLLDQRRIHLHRKSTNFESRHVSDRSFGSPAGSSAPAQCDWRRCVREAPSGRGRYWFGERADRLPAPSRRADWRSASP